MKTNTNAIIIHGGGLVDASKEVLLRIAENLQDTYEKVYIGKYSFEALYSPELWVYYTPKLEVRLKDKRGCYFGTSRGIDLTEPELGKKAIECLKKRNVATIIVAGGDGSSRQVAEISQNFNQNGINIIFAVPLTIDGINGGESIGLKEAVRESVRQIENVASTTLETRDSGSFSSLFVELQGRNRDDILANVLYEFVQKGKVADFRLEQMLFKVVPANTVTNDIDEEYLIHKINSSSKRTLILFSEGAKVNMQKFAKSIKRKTRFLTVGYSSQSNGWAHIFVDEYTAWMKDVCKLIKKDPKGSYCISKSGNILNKERIDYYARLNPRIGQKAMLEDILQSLLIQWS